LSRIAWLLFALSLSLPTFDAAHRLLTTSLFLVEFLSEGRWRPLSAVTETPQVSILHAPPSSPALAADLYATPALVARAGLVLVHGIAPRGKDDPHLRDAAALIARAGYAVAVPTIDGLTVLRLRPEDADAVSAAIRALVDAGHRPVSVLGVSLGCSPALLAAGDPSIASWISAVLALGGYASAVELLRYTLTGAYQLDAIRGQRPVDERGIARFARANADLLDGAGQRLVANRDPASVDGLIRELPPSTRHLLEQLSPDRSFASIRAPIFLVHGRGDPTVPFTETLRLDGAARAAGRRVTTVIVGAVGHVDPGAHPTLGDLARLAAAFYAFNVAAQRPR